MFCWEATTWQSTANNVIKETKDYARGTGGGQVSQSDTVLGVTWDTIPSSWTGTSSFRCAMDVLYAELIQRHDELF